MGRRDTKSKKPRSGLLRGFERRRRTPPLVFTTFYVRSRRYASGLHYFTQERKTTAPHEPAKSASEHLVEFFCVPSKSWSRGLLLRDWATWSGGHGTFAFCVVQTGYVDKSLNHLVDRCCCLVSLLGLFSLVKSAACASHVALNNALVVMLSIHFSSPTVSAELSRPTKAITITPTAVWCRNSAPFATYSSSLWKVRGKLFTSGEIGGPANVTFRSDTRELTLGPFPGLRLVGLNLFHGDDLLASVEQEQWHVYSDGLDYDTIVVSSAG